MKKILLLISFVLLMSTVFLTYTLSVADDVGVYRFNIYANDMSIEDIVIISGKNWTYIPDGYTVSKTSEMQISSFSVSISKGNDLLMSGVSALDFPDNVDFEPSETYTNKMGVSKGDMLLIELQYKRNGNPVEYYETINLQEKVVTEFNVPTPNQ